MRKCLVTILYIISLFFLISCSNDDCDFTISKPNFITSDIELFWKTFDNSTNFSSTDFQKLYINQGTIGLKDYAIQKRLAYSLQPRLRSNAYLNYYNSIRNNTLEVSDAIQKSGDAFLNLKEIHANTKFYNVYFLIGAMTAGGRVSDNGLLIAVEMFSKNTDTHLGELSEWHQNIIRNKESLPSIVVHEFVHMQQQFKSENPNYRTVLEQSILEGMADFISNHLLNGEPFMNEHLHIYGNPLEKELWNDFKLQINLNYKNSEWLYTGKPTSKGYPADMGYYVGFKILESFSKNFNTIEEAITAMLKAKNYNEIFERSGYKNKF